VIAADNQTAFSDVLDGPAIAAADAGAPAPLATDASGQFTAGSDSPPHYSCDGGPCPPHAAQWAVKNDCGSNTKLLSTCNNGIHDDCTDFVSRALHFGGGFPQISHGNRLFNTKDPDQWYQVRFLHGLIPRRTSWAWANAYWLANFERRYGGYYYKFKKTPQITSQIGDGALIFASHGAGKFAEIFHTGIVSRVTGRNLFITQHTFNYVNRPLWAQPGHPSWFNDRYRHAFIVSAVWVVNPVIIRSYKHH